MDLAVEAVAHPHWMKTEISKGDLVCTQSLHFLGTQVLTEENN